MVLYPILRITHTHPPCMLATKLPFARYTIIVAIHFCIRAVFYEIFCFFVRTHLTAMLASITLVIFCVLSGFEKPVIFRWSWRAF